MWMLRAWSENTNGYFKNGAERYARRWSDEISLHFLYWRCRLVSYSLISFSFSIIIFLSTKLMIYSFLHQWQYSGKWISVVFSYTLILLFLLHPWQYSQISSMFSFPPRLIRLCVQRLTVLGWTLLNIINRSIEAIQCSAPIVLSSVENPLDFTITALALRITSGYGCLLLNYAFC